MRWGIVKPPSGWPERSVVAVPPVARRPLLHRWFARRVEAAGPGPPVPGAAGARATDAGAGGVRTVDDVSACCDAGRGRARIGAAGGGTTGIRRRYSRRLPARPPAPRPPTAGLALIVVPAAGAADRRTGVCRALVAAPPVAVPAFTAVPPMIGLRPLNWLFMMLPLKAPFWLALPLPLFPIGVLLPLSSHQPSSLLLSANAIGASESGPKPAAPGDGADRACAVQLRRCAGCARLAVLYPFC